MKKSRDYKLIKNALFSMQFWKDKDNTPQFTITSKKSNINWPADMFIFGRNLAQTNLLDENELSALMIFCGAYIKERERIVFEVRNLGMPIYYTTTPTHR